MTVLIIAEHNNRNLKPATAQVVTAALEMGGPVDVLVLGNDCRSIAEEAAKIAGVRTAYFADNPQFAQESPEAIAAIVVREGKGYDHILFVTGALGKTVMPRVAALMDVSPVSEILAVKGPKTFVRGMYAGSILATVEVDEPVVVATVRGTAFAAAGEQAPALVEEVDAPAVETKSRFVSFSETKSDRPELVSARVVLAGGCGLLDETGFGKLTALADKVGAAVGATRTAVDMGLCPNDWQIGQTGKIVAPDLYIGVGLSGAIQHTAGIKDAKVIVAVNNDPEAPIFEICDYGLVADGAATLDALKEKL